MERLCSGLGKQKEQTTKVQRWSLLRMAGLRSHNGIVPVLIACFAFWAAADVRGQSVSADSTIRETVVVEIRIGQREIAANEWGDIVVSQNDSIRVEYRCRVHSDKFDAKLFMVTLRSGDGQERVDAVRSPSIVWTGLQQQRYTFTVQAFAPGLWRATPVSIDFVVDDAEAARRLTARLQQQVQEQKRDSVAKDTVIQERASGNMKQGAMIALAVFLIGGVAATVFYSLRQRKNRLSDTNVTSMAVSHTGDSAEGENGKDMGQPSLSYEDIVAENSALRAEIAALRGQIEALQVRTKELQKNNRDLASQKERLLEHKSQLEELQVQKDELFSMVVHDMKNPAGLIRGLVELLRSYDLTAQEQQEIMEDLMATSSRILSLAQEVSRIMTLESGVLALDIQSYPIREIIEDVCRRNSAVAGKKNIEIQREMPDGLPDVELDAQKIEEVLDNLVSNAVKFSNADTLVKVKAALSGKSVIVEIVDNGPGLTEADVKRAFGRGARLSAKPTAGEPSSGLGLWIVKKIVEAHHGRVWVKSSILKGSTFAFEIPVQQPASEAE